MEQFESGSQRVILKHADKRMILIVGERGRAFERVSASVRLRLVPRSIVLPPAFADKYRACGGYVRSMLVLFI